jgi:hypothetical protein
MRTDGCKTVGQTQNKDRVYPLGEEGRESDPPHMRVAPTWPWGSGSELRQWQFADQRQSDRLLNGKTLGLITQGSRSRTGNCGTTKRITTLSLRDLVFCGSRRQVRP